MLRLTAALFTAAIMLIGCGSTPGNNPSQNNTVTEFPTIQNLNPVQQKIVGISQQEFQAQPPGSKYSDGANEAWCANFISWVYREADIPLENPNSGGWRIPGIYTLKEYLETNGRFHPVDSGYVPQTGDIAIYQGSPIFGDHANIVLQESNGVLTTVGGNEEGKIRIYTNNQKDYTGLLGYGSLQ
ncbi:hypothetical protein CFREI_11500 [Corynebacterium freiburgense]|nr:hypothetical protein CFREI_11500 [Corynebacterium freiburgense]